MADLLEKYRKLDEDKTAQGETIPEQQTMNGPRVGKFLEEQGLTVDNFNDRFKVEMALEFVQESKAKGEQNMFEIISKTYDYFKKIGLPDLIEEQTRTTFETTMRKEVGINHGESEDFIAQLIEGYETYQTVRRQLKIRLAVVQRTREEIGEERELMGEKTFSEDVKDIWKDVKKNFRKMDGKEKAVVVGGLLLLGIYAMTSESETAKKVKKVFKGALYLFGGGLFANYAWKLATGKSAIDAFSEWNKGSVGKTDFFEKHFRTTAENNEIMQKGMVYLGDKDFLYLADEYQKAKAKGEKEIKIPDVDPKKMKPAEIYTALDIFFKKYPEEKLILRFRNEPEKQTFLQVFVIMMAENKDIGDVDGLVSRAAETIDDLTTRGWNFFWTGMGFETTRKMYRYVHGKEGEDKEVKEWAERSFAHDTNTMDTLRDNFLIQKFPARHQNFRTLLQAGQVDGTTGATFYENANDSVYVMGTAYAEQIVTDSAHRKEAFEKARTQAIAFLRTKYATAFGGKENVEKFLIESGGVMVIMDQPRQSYRYFVRMPLPGTKEFRGIQAGIITAENLEERADTAIFEKDIEYDSDFFKRYQEEFRLRFYIASDQKEEAQKVLNWFNEKYKTQHVKISAVLDKILHDDKDKEQAWKECGLIGPEDEKDNRGLWKRRNVLKEHVARIDDIEEEAADEAVNAEEAKNDVIVLLKKELGYKVRLALLGDPAAKAAINFAPEREDAIERLLENYEERSAELVEKYNKGVGV
jgi:hypothetical protein